MVRRLSHLLVVLVGVAAAAPAASAAVLSDACGLPTAGVKLAPGLVRGCEPPAGAGIGAPGATVRLPVECTGPVRCERWRARQAQPGAPGDGILSGEMAVASADERVLYVAAYAGGGPTVTAYDVRNGAELWTARQQGRPDRMPFAITRASDGSLAVALLSYPPEAAGGLLWIVDPTGTTRHTVATGAGEALDVATAGDLVVAAGTTAEPDRATATAVDPRTGEVAWTTSWTSELPGLRGTSGWRVAGTATRAYLAAAGTAQNGDTVEHALITMDAADGTIERVSSRPGLAFPPAALVTSPDGGRVAFVAANYEDRLNEILTMVFDGDGNRLWVSRHRGCDTFKCSTRPWYGAPVTFSDDGREVVATGLGVTVGGNTAWVTVSHDAATGAERWAVRHPGNPKDCFCGPAVTSRGGQVYVTGTLFDAVATSDAITMALARGDGALTWLARDRDPEKVAYASSIAMTSELVLSVGGDRSPIAAGTTTVRAYPR